MHARQTLFLCVGLVCRVRRIADRPGVAPSMTRRQPQRARGPDQPVKMLSAYALGLVTHYHS
jgi:hypothetical protein